MPMLPLHISAAVRATARYRAFPASVAGAGVPSPRSHHRYEMPYPGMRCKVREFVESPLAGLAFQFLQLRLISDFQNRYHDVLATNDSMSRGKYDRAGTSIVGRKPLLARAQGRPAHLPVPHTIVLPAMVNKRRCVPAG